MKPLLLTILVFLSACATVQQADLDAWINVPVEALDTHLFFATVPMNRTVSPSGLEVRNYSNMRQQCGGMHFGYGLVGMDCRQIGCNNIFYIKDGLIIKYTTQGRCRTDYSTRPYWDGIVKPDSQ